MIPETRIYRLLDVIVGEVAAHYETVRVGLPERRYVSAGPPAWDCEQVAVYTRAVYPSTGMIVPDAPPSFQASAGWAMRSALVAVEVVRAVPVLDDSGNAPTVEELSDSARRLYGDGQLTINALITAIRSGALPDVDDVAFNDWTIVGPDGGFAGSVLAVTVGLAALAGTVGA
jgi:hypothetical protein